MGKIIQLHRDGRALVGGGRSAGSRAMTDAQISGTVTGPSRSRGRWVWIAFVIATCAVVAWDAYWLSRCFR